MDHVCGGCSERCYSSKPPQECNTRDVNFLQSDSRCRRYVTVLSNIPPRYAGSEQKGMVSLLCLIFSSRLAYRLLSWKTASTTFVMLSLTSRSGGLTYGCHVIALHPFHCFFRLHEHAWVLGRWRMHTFWRRWLAGQRYRCWREVVPGRIPVGRRSWGVVTYFVWR